MSEILKSIRFIHKVSPHIKNFVESLWIKNIIKIGTKIFSTQNKTLRGNVFHVNSNAGFYLIKRLSNLLNWTASFCFI